MTPTLCTCNAPGDQCRCRPASQCNVPMDGYALARTTDLYELGKAYGQLAHRQGFTLEDAMNCGTGDVSYLEGVYDGFARRAGAPDER